MMTHNCNCPYVAKSYLDINNDDKEEKAAGISKHTLTKIFTLEEVCPTWARKMKVGLSEADRHILSHDSKYCLVGESCGFN